jgi:invasion protein IalB|tara:strand:+ start:644 stop:1159 length:516 start_codon:yes stop_codon:yes gene_type:complete
MSIIKKIILKSLIILFLNSFSAFSNEVQKVGKFKDWDVMVLTNQTEKICFAQSKPVLQSPKKNQRDARLFVSFRPGEKISDEISITSGYEYNTQNSIIASSGKSKFKFDIAQENFAWIASNKIEKKMIKKMKKGSRIMITGYNKSGSQTKDHYSLMGFTKAYNQAKKSCNI